ncbi:MAG: LysM peptidoglycan-binding domain-containing protein [Myxococcales bacterium]|nr:LysM peptidoglycan-binding domain-containing protein [Myxococcales bacterium]MCB9627257.1 LysM peptidoglycan-binding domain-containing protein [Sandaracinaceae bacterium]
MKSYRRIALVLALMGLPVADAALETGSTARAQRQSVRVVGGGGNVPDVHVVRTGDTLWDISGRYFGNPWEWPRIWSYNPEITNPHWIYPSDHVRLRVGGTEVASAPGIQRRPRVSSGTIWLRDQGYLDTEARERSGVIVGSREDQMLLSEHDEVYVRFGDEVTPTPGRIYTVYRNIGRSERTDQDAGVLVRVLGTVRLMDYDRDRQLGRATIVESLEPIERGFLIAEIDRSFAVVPPRVNEADVDATIVALLQPTVFLADQQVGFLDRGSAEGVQLGNRFMIVRAGDEWREHQPAHRIDLGETVPDTERPDEYPDEIVAEARVVQVREHTCTVMMTTSIRAVEVGDRAQMRQGF